MASVPLDFRNVNSLWCSVLAETLARSGVERVVVAPGSRSAPLVFALARHEKIEAIPVLDERSAGFFALGQAKASGRTVALVCTSGTAAANFLPAVVEAHESGVPLLVLTADRPPELRACHAGQTIDQQKLYGGFVGFYHELAVPEAEMGLLRYLRQTVAHAVARTRLPFAGPVHLNAPFRDPLPPIETAGVGAFTGEDWERFFSQVGPVESAPPKSPAPVLPATDRGVIVAGPVHAAKGAAYAAEVGDLARRLGWPVLADALSPVRHHAGEVPGVVTTYDAILRDASMASALRPEAVVCLGTWPTSKVLRGWIEESGAPIWLAARRAENRDGLHGRTRQVLLSVGDLAEGVMGRRRPGAYARAWAREEAVARRTINGRLRAEKDLFEPKAAWLLARRLPAGTPVFFASSMPVRDAEYVWPANGKGIRPLFNRGANGIDGTLSSALGAAHGGRPAVLVTGDLALLHDTNGFLIRPKFRGSLTVVLINNRGGGIFEHLPVAKFDPPFEEFFATPQEADFAKLCAAYGVEHVAVRDWGQFERLVAKLPKAGLRVLEVRTDRKRDAAGRRRLLAVGRG